MGWLNTSVRFPTRGVLLTLSRRDEIDAELFEGLTPYMDGYKLDPYELEKRFRKMLAKYRPELSGGTLCAMELDLRRGEWQFMYEHGSLKTVPLGIEYERLPLIPQSELESPKKGEMLQLAYGWKAKQAGDEPDEPKVLPNA